MPSALGLVHRLLWSFQIWIKSNFSIGQLVGFQLLKPWSPSTPLHTQQWTSSTALNILIALFSTCNSTLYHLYIMTPVIWKSLSRTKSGGTLEHWANWQRRENCEKSFWFDQHSAPSLTNPALWHENSLRRMNTSCRKRATISNQLKGLLKGK